jgi:uncharacterized protein (DUF3820 family)
MKNMMNRSYKTTKGTELPLLNLKGKEYLEVKYRLVWFREDHPDWSIETELISVTEVSAYARATIRDEHGRIIATSHKFENVKGFPDFIEKSETGAIGRALALIGYGTQFCADELDEGKRIVDAPATAPRNNLRVAPEQRSTTPARPQPAAAAATSAPAPAAPTGATPAAASDTSANALQDDEDETSEENLASNEPGEFTISFGRKYKGRKLSDIPKSEMESYLEWLENSAVRSGTPLSRQVQFLKNAFTRLYTEAASH